MRLDVYQHVQKDIDDIESIVSGEPTEPQSKARPDLLGLFVTEAYAADELSPEIEQAAVRRRDRRAELVSWQVKGVIGENRSGLVVVWIPGHADASVQALVESENSDRMAIYRGIAEKNGTSVGEVQKLYAERLQGDAESGTPIEVLNEATGAYEWQTKN
jgi:uncharacterized protein YdbL (DUF1318 family)